MVEDQDQGQGALGRKVLCTFPGKFGDLLWSLPTVRAVSACVGAPVDLVIAGAFASIVPLLREQPYLGKVTALPAWEVQDTAPMTPRTPPLDAEEYDQVFHLGYDGWPRMALPREIHRILGDQWPWPTPIPAIDLSRPWITPPSWARNLAPVDVATGWTDEHLELKVGVHQLVWRRNHASLHGVDLSAGPRWLEEYQQIPGATPMSWEHAAACISRATVFLGDCSALHVLACAIGTPCVIMEPAEARHHSIFWPFGTTGPQVTQVIGGDGRWTFDARHVWDTVDSVGARRVAEGMPV